MGRVRDETGNVGFNAETGEYEDLMAAGVTALKIEGRQRGRSYVREVVSAVRRAADAAARGERIAISELDAMTEGGRTTEGAYGKSWQ